jgi:hypothetical protein
LGVIGGEITYMYIVERSFRRKKARGGVLYKLWCIEKRDIYIYIHKLTAYKGVHGKVSYVRVVKLSRSEVGYKYKELAHCMPPSPAKCKFVIRQNLLLSPLSLFFFIA